MNFNEHQGTERYLNAATRGLWGRHRRALKAELRGHITARVQDFRLGGLSAAEAERQTLRELGAPVRVSGGMLGVYALPALGRAGALSALLMTGLLTVLPQGLAQVGSLYTSPRFVTTSAGEVQFGASSYLDFDQLKKELKKAGVQLQGSIDNPTLIIPGTPRPTQLLEYVSPEYGGSTFQNGRSYIMTNTLLNGLQNSGANVSIT
uniref:permease prefix domain 1-containing protein n=1 Tax=Deinococcus sp. TaxID=47478 RepID=UPI00286E5470